MSATLDTFQVSLPPLRAALVPSWATAPQSVPEAFSQDFLFPPSADQIRTPGFSSLFTLVQLLSSAAGWKTVVRVRSAAGVERSALGFGGDGKGAHARTQTSPQAFQTIVNPPAWTSAAADHLLVFPPKVLIQLRTPGSPLSFRGRALDTRNLGFDKQAEERSAVHTSVIL